MGTSAPTDEALLAAADAAGFEPFYLRHVARSWASSPAARGTPSWPPT